ncbi:MAG: hypothetical protein KC766_26535 [Myxococcales bacterium]|nr:hypothetical protein [Myxococcales bacterium]
MKYPNQHASVPAAARLLDPGRPLRPIRNGARALGVFAVVVAGFASACTASDGEGGVLPGSGGTGGSAGQTSAASIEFASDGTLLVEPLVATELVVQVRPVGRHTVRFSLTGDSLDASLAATEVSTDSAGVATTTLFAPSHVTSFNVRAAVGTEVSASKTVSVSEQGFGTLRVTPEYSGGRDVTSWTASVHPGRRCSDLSGNPPPDGALWTTVSPGQTIEIESVPAGTYAAVTLRANQFAGGCSDLSGVMSGETKSVDVQVINRPLQLSETDLDMTLGLDDLNYDWELGLDGARADAKAALLGEAQSDVGALLDAMAASLPGSAASLFQTSRDSGAWDAQVATWIGAGSTDVLRTALDQWFDASAPRLSGDRVLFGKLEASGTTPGWATWKLEEVAGLSPTKAGFPPDIGKLSLSSDPDDSLLLGGSFYFFPSRLVVGAAEQQAISSSTNASTGGEALAELIDCEGLGASLAGQGELFDGCDGECGALACKAGLQQLFSRARDASIDTPATLTFSAAAAAEIDSEARPTAFEGTWVGELDDQSDTPLSLSGSAKGAQSLPPQ